MTTEKKNSSKRRVILDLTYPGSGSVNSDVDKETYLGDDFQLKLPGPLALKKILGEMKNGYVWTLDLCRGYRQMRADPIDYPLLGFCWREKFYFDLSVPFGLRHGARNMQQITEALVRMLQAEGVTALAYIDDVAGVAETYEEALRGFNIAINLMQKLGLQEAKNKRSPPKSVNTWLGVEFDCVTRQMRIPPNKIHDGLVMVNDWLN